MGESGLRVLVLASWKPVKLAPRAGLEVDAHNSRRNVPVVRVLEELLIRSTPNVTLEPEIL